MKELTIFTKHSIMFDSALNTSLRNIPPGFLNNVIQTLFQHQTLLYYEGVVPDALFIQDRCFYKSHFFLGIS